MANPPDVPEDTWDNKLISDKLSTLTTPSILKNSPESIISVSVSENIPLFSLNRLKLLSNSDIFKLLKNPSGLLKYTKIEFKYESFCLLKFNLFFFMKLLIYSNLLYCCFVFTDKSLSLLLK